MLTQAQIDDIDRRLQEGEHLEAIGVTMGKTLQQMRYALMASGKKMQTSRRLVDCAPVIVGEDRQLELAAH